MKCGNYWLYQILQEIIREAGIENKNFIKNDSIQVAAKTWQLSFPEQHLINHLKLTPRLDSYRIGNVFQMPINDIDTYLDNNTHVWTHSEINERTLEVMSKFDKIVYIIRDPRDRLISWANFWFSPYRKKYTPHYVPTPEIQMDKHLEAEIDSWQRHVLDYLKISQQYGIHVIFYENLIANFENELENLLNYLEIDLDDDERNRIQYNTSFNVMKKTSPNHVRKGGSYKWISLMSLAQQKRVLNIAQKSIEILDYPVNPSNKKKLPSLDKATLENIKDIQDSFTRGLLKQRLKSTIIRIINQL